MCTAILLVALDPPQPSFYLDFSLNSILRHSFDPPSGLIYQTALVTYQIKGDPKERKVEVPGIAVLHKRVGGHQVTGFETYMDKEPLVSIIQEVLGQGDDGGV